MSEPIHFTVKCEKFSIIKTLAAILVLMFVAVIVNYCTDIKEVRCVVNALCAGCSVGAAVLCWATRY